MGNKHKHLEFIQAIINRMANTSFLLKGWSITLIAGLFAFSVKEGTVAVLWLALLLTLVFWFLDSYFLWQERLFRGLYEQVRLQSETEIDFSMNQMRFKDTEPWYTVPFSLTLLPFYGLAVIAQTLFIIRLC